MSVEKRAGLWLVVRPETQFCHCNLTLCFCNDSPGGTNDFLHWCCYCWSHHKFKRKVLAGWAWQDGRRGGGLVEEKWGGEILQLKQHTDLSPHLFLVGISKIIPVEFSFSYSAHQNLVFSARSVCPAGLAVAAVQLRSMCHNFPSTNLKNNTSFHLALSLSTRLSWAPSLPSLLLPGDES